MKKGTLGEEASSNRYTTNAQIVQALTAFHKVRPINVIHFFSEGKEKYFQDIIDACRHLEIECKFHLNKSLMATHYSLSIADVLVMARSSFSTTAGLLNKKLVLQDIGLLDSNLQMLERMDLQAKLQHMGAINTMKKLQASSELSKSTS